MLPCTMPWVWYKISKVLNFPKTALVLLFLGIVLGIFQVYDMLRNTWISSEQYGNKQYADDPSVDWIHLSTPEAKPEIYDASVYEIVFYVATGVSIVVGILLTIVRYAYNKRFKTAGELSSCCERTGCLSCLEIWFCNPCVAGQMGKTLEANGFNI